MAAIIKVTLFLVVIFAMANSQRVVDAARGMPPNLPWVPSFVECDFNYVSFKNGPICNDCYSTIHCKPKFGVLRNCFGSTPYCVNGKCVAQPSADCSDAETVTDIPADE